MALRTVLAICLGVSLQAGAIGASEQVEPRENATRVSTTPVLRFVSCAISRPTAAGGATRMTSTNFASTATAAQMSPAGGASFCDAGSRTTAGFRSVRGLGPVPILRMGHRDLADPLDVDLQWSGAASTYQLYRAYTPVDIFNPANLDRETTICSGTDGLAFQSNLIF